MNPLIMPLTVIRDVVYEDYVFIPSSDGITGQDLTDYTLQAQICDRPNGTKLADFTCTASTPPPGISNPNGWVQIRLDDSVVIPTGYYRGTWSLLAGLDGANPFLVAAGPVEIVSQASVWA